MPAGIFHFCFFSIASEKEKLKIDKNVIYSRKQDFSNL